MGGITEIATGAPGYCSVLPNTMSPLARTLKLNGYSTAQFGKCHEVPVWETSPAGPFDAWPTGGGGFEYFYGFIGGEANQWYPTLYEGTTPVEPKKTPEEGYHLVEDMTDKAMDWIGAAEGARAGQAVLRLLRARARPTRRTTCRRNGPTSTRASSTRAGTSCARRPSRGRRSSASSRRTASSPRATRRSRRGTTMPEALKPVLRREMEVYAGFLEYTDHHVGRLLDGLKKLGILDDTLVYYIIGDNGASAEGTLNGTYNEMSYFNGLQALETPEFLTARIDKLGGPESYNHYAVGWAHAMNTPYQWTKQVASHWGGTRNGTIVHWPKGIKAKGEIRSQFHHVIDVAPTILEAAGLPEPVSVNGVQQDPIEGVSMLYSFNDAKAAERHETQYFEMFGNRGIYHKGWTAVTQAQDALDCSSAKDAGLRRRRLGALRHDQGLEPGERPVQADAGEAPRAAAPVADRGDALQRAAARRPDGREDEPGHRRPAGADQGEDPAPLRRHGAPVGELRPQHQEQVALRHRRDRGAGEGRRGRDHRPGREHRRLEPLRQGRQAQVLLQLGRRQVLLSSRPRTPIPAGEHQVRMEFAYAGGGLGKGGKVTLYIDGKKVGEGDIEATLAMVFSADDGCDVGEDTGAPVSPDYGPRGNAFNGQVKGVQLAIAEAAENADHLVTPEDAIRIAMARQ